MPNNIIWLSEMKISDIDRLEEVFAYLTDVGWIIPVWLVELRIMVENKETNPVIIRDICS